MTDKKEKFLFINFGGIGDEILFLPTIQAVKNKFPNSYIVLCTEKRSRSIENLTTIIDEVHTIDQTKNRYWELLKLLLWTRFQKFDYVISSGISKCSICGELAVPCNHEYDNDCDDSCNKCNGIRKVSHKYVEKQTKDVSQNE